MSFVVRQAGVDDVEGLVETRMAFIDDVRNSEVEILAEELARRVRESIAQLFGTGDLVAWFAEVASEPTPVGMTMVVFHRRPPSNANVTGVEAY